MGHDIGVLGVGKGAANAQFLGAGFFQEPSCGLPRTCLGGWLDIAEERSRAGIFVPVAVFAFTRGEDFVAPGYKVYGFDAGLASESGSEDDVEVVF